MARILVVDDESDSSKIFSVAVARLGHECYSARSGGEALMLFETVKPDLVLLDEPTNDLDVETLRALEQALLEFPGSAIVISHDRWFLDRIATHILAFEGDSQVAWFAGNYADYEEDRRRRLGSDANQPHRIKYKRLDS